MTRIIQLLTQKNHYLEKFYSLNEDELLNFQLGQFDNIEYFYQTREKILENVRYIDDQIAQAQNELQVTAAGEAVDLQQSDRQEVRENLAIKDEYVNRILAQDLEILSCIEQAKSEIIRELRDIRKNKKAFSGYKSGNQSHRLNEEA